MNVLVVAEHRDGTVRGVTRELVAAARELGAGVSLAVVAEDPAPLLEQMDTADVDEILAVAAGAPEFENDTYQAAVAALARERRPDAIFLAHSVDAMGYAPALAVELGAGFASDVCALRAEGGRLAATRAYHGGKVHGELTFDRPPPVVLLLRPSTWPPAEGVGTARVTHVQLGPVPVRARHRRFVSPEAADVDITKADFLLSVGRGIGDRDNLEIFESLAEQLGATLAVSRPLVDAGWVPSSRQVGQSGRTVNPKVYLALGISGAFQHLAGIKAAETIIAVNSDPEAAIFGIAQYGAVADLFDVADELEKLG